MRRTPSLGRMLLAALAVAAPASAADWDLIVRGGERDLRTVPICVDVPEGLAGPRARLVGPEGETVPVLIQGDGGRHRLYAVIEHIPARSERRWRIEPTDEPAGHGVQIANEGTGRIDVLMDGELLTRFVLDDATKPYLHPLIGPTGRPMTRAYPMAEVPGEARDHPHQRSFWFTHGSVNGFDFWGSDPKNGDNPRFGRIRTAEATSLTENGPAPMVRVDLRNEWLGPDGSVVCEEARRTTFWVSRSPRIIDVDITVKAVAGPVTFGDTKEGSFGLRVASSMDVKRQQGGRITNAEGITDAQAWGKPSPWVDYTGPVDGQTVGIAILNHPESFRYPTTWHVRDYGLFAANPFGWTDFGRGKSGVHTIPPGGTMTLRYRLILHEGDTAAADIAGAFEGYANPPKLEVVPR